MYMYKVKKPMWKGEVMYEPVIYNIPERLSYGDTKNIFGY